MKTLSLVFTLLFISGICFATVRTVSNHPLGGAQYSSLESAYLASASGDTLLLEGTDIAYEVYQCGPPFWTKQVVVIGIGFNPNKQIPKRTKLGTNWNPGCGGTRFHFAIGSSGCQFYGIEFTVPVDAASDNANNLLFEDCKFNTTVSFGCGSASNFIVRNCIFDQDNVAHLVIGNCGTGTSGIISNCVFDGYINCNNNPLVTLNIEHCVFLSTTVAPFSGLYNSNIRDNIFMNMFPDGTVNCIYNNNLSRVAGTFPPDPGDGNTAMDNIEETDPMFVDVPASTLYTTAHDYHLDAGSAALGAASDGTDIGVHGGFTGFAEEGESLINPIVRAMTIINTSVAPNGTLQVQIHATKPDSD